MQRICEPFFRICLCLSRDFNNRHFFFTARFTLRQPKTPVSNATNLQTFCFEDFHYAFQETLCPVTLTHQILVFYSNLYFYTSDTFQPFLRFSHILLCTNFLLRILPREIFFLSLMTVHCSEFNYYF